MRTIVFVHRSHADEAIALVEELREAGDVAFYRDTHRFSGDTERADRVITDNAAVAEAFAAKGIPSEPFSAAPEPTPEPDPEPEPAPADEGGDPVSDGEYEVEQSGTWYKLIDPDGEQVGKSVRSEEDAWALLEDD